MRSDAMDDDRLALPVGAEMALEIIDNGRLVFAALKRHRQQTSRLVQDDEVLIFVQDVQVTGLEREGPSLRAAGAILPDAHHVALLETDSHVERRNLCVVEKHLPFLARVSGAGP